MPTVPEPAPPEPSSDVAVLGVLADWSGAGIAFLALVVAILAARATIHTNQAQQRTLDLQRRQFEAAEARAERDQASKIAIVETDAVLQILDDRRIPDDRHERQIAIINASDRPVYELGVLSSGDTLLLALVQLLPTGTEPAVVGLFHDGAIGSMEVFFKDAAGVRWHRTSDGGLHKQTAEHHERLHQAYSDHRSRYPHGPGSPFEPPIGRLGSRPGRGFRARPDWLQPPASDD